MREDVDRDPAARQAGDDRHEALKVPHLRHAKDGDGAVRGKVNATRIAIDSLAGKVETYSLDNGSPPQRIEDLVQKPGDASNWQGPYAKEKELKDPWNHPFVYRYPGDKGGDFDLYSLGPDGKEGGEGLKGADIGNW